MGKFIDLSGKRFGDLTVLSQGASRKGQAFWVVECACGKTIEVNSYSLRKIQRSCGCKRKTRETHGMTDTPTWRSYRNMLSRCLNKNVPAYKNYGGRGISVCDRWMVFENFLADMGVMPDSHSIERIDVNGNYEPSNCHWIPKKLQSKNRRNSILINGEPIKDYCSRSGVGAHTIIYRLKHGVQLDKRVGQDKIIECRGMSLNLSQWAQKLGVARSTISMRLRKGLPVEKVLQELSCS